MSLPKAEHASSDRVARDVLDSLLEGCQVIGFDWTYLYVNDTVATQARRSREHLVGRTMMECFPGIDTTPMFSALRQCMTERGHGRMENEFKFPDGSQGWFELRFIPVPEGACILSLDISESKRTAAALARSEDQLRQAQKMEAVGRLAGGVAHDFNNLLSVVLSYASLLIDDLRPNDPMRADLQEIKRAGERAADLTRQLLTFSRQQVFQPRILDLNLVITDMDKMIRRLVGEDVDVRTAPGSGLGSVKADPGHIDQVIMNLVVNARDAMPHGGKLTIETQNVELDADYAEQHLGVTSGPHVMLAVSDTGIGMDKATQQRIFEPFFTTKEVGKGTGLGLSTVFGIVRQSAGSIWVYSEPGHGTTFKIYLPRTDEMDVVIPAPVQVATLRGTETVLLVEDDDQLRTVALGILTRNGYRILEARNGGEAFLLCAKHDGPIQLLLTDVVMPLMSGRELAERLAPLRSDMRVLYMSGYTEDAIVHHRVLSPGIALLQKPITPETLLNRVRQVLDADA
jgi:two-component system cell cycle sensor histidine kinase/response regulator CckA